MATALDRTIANLSAAMERASAVLASLDAAAAKEAAEREANYGDATSYELGNDPAASVLSMTYTDENGRNYGYNEYRAALLQQIKDYGETIASLQKAAQLSENGGSFTLVGRVGYG